MTFGIIQIYKAEITFTDKTTKTYEEVRMGEKANWVYTRNGEKERWFPVHRIIEVRRDI